MVNEYQLRVLPQVAYNEQGIIDFLAHDKGIDVRTVQRVRVLRRSIDARQRTVYVNLQVRVYINELPQDDAYTPTVYGDVSDRPCVIVVGMGTAVCLRLCVLWNWVSSPSCWNVARTSMSARRTWP